MLLIKFINNNTMAELKKKASKEELRDKKQAKILKKVEDKKMRKRKS